MTNDGNKPALLFHKWRIRTYDQAHSHPGLAALLNQHYLRSGAGGRPFNQTLARLV